MKTIVHIDWRLLRHALAYHDPQIRERQQFSGSRACKVDLFTPWVERGTSLAGLSSKKLAGFRDMTNFSTGITGKSGDSFTSVSI